MDRVRAVTPDDADAVAAVYAPYVRDTVISFELEPPDGAELRRRIAATTTTHPWLVAERDGEVVGFAYATAHRARAAYRWSVDVSVYLAPTAQGAGLGRKLSVPLLATLTRQGFVHAYAGIALPNPASVGLHEALGFAPVGVYRGVGFKHGRWVDVGWWSRELASPTQPAEPRPWDGGIVEPGR